MLDLINVYAMASTEGSSIQSVDPHHVPSDDEEEV